MPFTIRTGLTLVLPHFPWPHTYFFPQGYEAQLRDLDLLTSTNTGQQSYLHKLPQRRKELLTAVSFAEEQVNKKDRKDTHNSVCHFALEKKLL